MHGMQNTSQENYTHDHLGDNNHVTEVSLDDGGLLVGGSLSLSLAELLDEAHGLALQTPLELSAGTGVDDAHEVLVGHVEQSVKLDTTVRELAESSLPLELSSGSGVVVIPEFARTKWMKRSDTDSSYDKEQMIGPILIPRVSSAVEWMRGVSMLRC